MVTTLTKRMAEDLTDYLKQAGIKATYMHSDVKTIERMKIIRDLRMGNHDVLVGINLLREGLDLPEVSLVAILDADKEGFLRSETSMVQTIGRAARHLNGRVIMYGDRITRSMKSAIDETERRRIIQESYNKANGITPQSIKKSVRAIIEATQVAEDATDYKATGNTLDEKRLLQEIEAMRQAMLSAAERLEFEVAAEIRDELKMLEKELQARSQS